MSLPRTFLQPFVQSWLRPLRLELNDGVAGPVLEVSNIEGMETVEFDPVRQALRVAARARTHVGKFPLRADARLLLTPAVERRNGRIALSFGVSIEQLHIPVVPRGAEQYVADVTNRVLARTLSLTWHAGQLLDFDIPLPPQLLTSPSLRLQLTHASVEVFADSLEVEGGFEFHPTEAESAPKADGTR